MNKIKNSTICSIALLVFATACTRKDIRLFKEMIPLRNALAEKYKVADVNLTIWNGNSISVSFVNSAFNELPDAAKKIKAEEIARYVNTNYASIKNIQAILVGFVVYKNYIILNYSNSLNTYYFNTANL